MSETNGLNTLLIGPPKQGPRVTVSTNDLYLRIDVNDADDAEIVQLFLSRAERMRYGKAI